MAIDLGSQITKAVHLRGNATGFSLVNYTLLETPLYEKFPSRELLVEHFGEVVRALGASCKHVVFVVGGAETMLCHAELPEGPPPSELRRMVKLSPKNYLKLELVDFLFDCFVHRDQEAPSDATTLRNRRLSRVLVGGARRGLVENVQDAAEEHGLIIEELTLGPVGLANALQLLSKESHAEVAALLDIGFNHSSINIVKQGELVMTRVINVGSAKLADIIGKTGDPLIGADGGGAKMEEFQARVQSFIAMLGREVQASIEYFEAQKDIKVTEVLISGGAARSQFIIQSLEAEMELPCEIWTPAKCGSLEMPESRKGEVDYDYPQLAVAIGAAFGWLNGDQIAIDLLAEAREAREVRRRDPVRRATMVAGCFVAISLLWAGWMGFQLWRADVKLKGHQAELRNVENTYGQAIATSRMVGDTRALLRKLNQWTSNRFLFAPVMNALQYCSARDIEFHSILVSQSLKQQPVIRPGSQAMRGGRTSRLQTDYVARETMVLSIKGKSYDDARAVDRLIQTVSTHPYFQKLLRSSDPALLRALQGDQVDPVNPTRTFNFFEIECVFAERILEDE